MYLALRHFGSLSPYKKTSLLFFHFSFFIHKKIETNYFCFIFLHPIFQLPSFLFILDFYFFLSVFIFALVLSCLRIQFVTHFALHVFLFCSFCQSIQTARFSFRFTLSRCATSSSSLHINSSIWTVWLHTQRVLKTQSKHTQWNENINLYTYYHTIILACE